MRRQTTTGPGGLVDKGTKGKRARTVPLIPEIRDLVIHRLTTLDGKPDARLFTGPKGGLTCPRVSYPFRCEDRALLKDRIHRSSVFGPSHSFVLGSRSLSLPRSWTSAPEPCTTGSGKTRSTAASAPGPPPVRMPSWRRPTSASGSSRLKSRSSARPRNLSGKTVPTHKDSPGDRLPRRCRTPGQGLLPRARGQQPRLLPVQEPPDVADDDAPPVADRLDPGGPRGLTQHLRVPSCARRTDTRYGHRGQCELGRRTDAARRGRRPSRSGQGQAVERQCHSGRSRPSEVPSALAQ
ncbi:hypothetical protein FHU35_11204 [Saccharopolyspora dendranthemae]|uniref:Uncharacterized protein n=1 Tax=Saccharopolyspora dendranthemae TaxID=1181886 RepID=A0A561V7J3_9PSEU|nr:hypothetical protein FHU35_11204 [Saccharopolyspora dendranthemae]